MAYQKKKTYYTLDEIKANNTRATGGSGTTKKRTSYTLDEIIAVNRGNGSQGGDNIKVKTKDGTPSQYKAMATSTPKRLGVKADTPPAGTGNFRQKENNYKVKPNGYKPLDLSRIVTQQTPSKKAPLSTNYINVLPVDKRKNINGSAVNLQTKPSTKSITDALDRTVQEAKYKAADKTPVFTGQSLDRKDKYKYDYAASNAANNNVGIGNEKNKLNEWNFKDSRPSIVRDILNIADAGKKTGKAMISGTYDLGANVTELASMPVRYIAEQQLSNPSLSVSDRKQLEQLTMVPEVEQKLRDNADKWMPAVDNFAEELWYGVAKSTPQMLISGAAGKGLTGGLALKSAIASKIAQSLPFMLTAAGGYMHEAEQKGASTGKAMLSGMLSGAAEGLSEGIALDEALKGIGSVESTMMNEMFQEWVMGPVADLISKWTGVEDTSYLDIGMASIGREGLMNAASGLLMGGIFKGANPNKSVENKVAGQEKTLEAQISVEAEQGKALEMQKSAIQQHLIDSGVAPESSKITSEVLTKAFNGDPLSNNDTEAIINDDVARKMFEDVTGIIIPNGTMSQKRNAVKTFGQDVAMGRKEAITYQAPKLTSNETAVAEIPQAVETPAMSENLAPAVNQSAMVESNPLARMNTETVVEKKPSPLPTEISKYRVAGKKSLSKNMVENREEADFKAFNDFYEAGKVALPFNQVISNSNLSEAVKSSAYFAGVNDGKATANYKQGGLVDSSVNNAQGSFVDEFGKATGTQVHIVPTIADSNAESIANGQINAADIFIAEDTDKTVYASGLHEAGHRLEQLAPDEYAILVDYSTGRMKERMGSDFDTMSNGKKELYEGATGQAMPTNKLNSEIVNDFLEVVMNDETEAVRLVQHNRTLGEKILQIIQELLQTLKETVVSKQDDTYKLKTSELMKAKRLFADALEKSKENYKKGESIIEGDSNSYSLKDRVSGDFLLDAEDLIEEVKSVGGKVDANGYVTLYHKTSKSSADTIKSTGIMNAMEDGVFFSTKADGQIEGYGDTLIELKVPIEKLELDDIFDDEAHLKIPLKNRNQKLDVGKYLVDNVNTNFSLKDSTGKELSKEQAEFFKDSKVRDEKGNLQRVYHGTDAKFTVFNSKFQPQFFSGSKEYAQSFGKKVMEGYLNIKNPFDTRDGKALSIFNKEYSDYRNTKKSIPYIPIKQGQMIDFVNADGLYPFLRKMKREGLLDYDGILVHEGIDGEYANSYVPLNSNQVKSVDNLNPTEDVDINYSLKAGKATINQEKAIKEFGTTENFSEAGYLLPDGKILDFSDKKNGGKPNRRSMDHRDIDAIYDEIISAREAMNQFISEGNIRIMAESPGVDMSNTIPPTNEQIQILKRFIHEYARAEIISENRFAVDFSKEDGKPAGTLRYEGRINYNKVINDILHYYETGELLVQSDVSRFSYSLKMNTKAIIENAKLKERNDYLKNEMKTSAMPTVNKNKVDKYARELLKSYSSKYNRDELTGDMQTLYNYLATEAPDFEEAKLLAQKIAMDILENSVVLQDNMYADYKELRNEIRKSEIKIPDEDKAIFPDGYAGFRKKTLGKMKLGNKGTSIDIVYTDLMNNYPGVFDEELTGTVEQLEEMLRVFDGTTPFEENPYSADMAEATASLSMDILDNFFELPEHHTFADKQNKKLVKAKIKAASKVSELKADNAQRIAEIKANAHDRRMELIDKERARRIEIHKKAAEKLQNRLSDVRSNLNRKEKIKRILNISKDLLQRINKPTDKKHVPESLVNPLREFLNVLSAKAGKDKLRDGLTKLRLTLANNLIVDNGVTYSNAIDEDFTKKIDELISELLQSESIPEMTEVEVNELYDIMKGVRKITRDYNTLQYDGRRQVVDDLGSAVIQENYAKEDYQGRGDGLRGLLDFDNLRSFAYFKKLGNTMYSLFQNLRTGQDTFFRNAETIRQYMHNLRTKSDGKLIDMTSWSGEKADTNIFKLESEETIKLTPAQVMSLYLLNKREQARYHIYNGGIRRADIFIKKKKNVNSDVFKVTEADVEKITASLTAEQRKIADGIAEFFRTTSAQWGNEVSMKLFGYMKFKDENYFPIDVDRNSLTAMFGSVHEKSLQNNSSTIATVEKAANPIILQDAVSVFSRSASQMGLYNGIVVAINDMNKVMNFKPKDGKGVMGAIEKKFGKKAIDYYRRLIVDLNGGMRTEIGSEWLSKQLGRFKAAKIGFNLRVVIQQPVSMVRAAGEINVNYLLRGIATKGGLEKAKKYAPITLWKSWGYFSNDIGRSLEDVFLDRKSARESVFFGPIQAADNVAWSKLWGAVELETKDKFPSLKVGSEEFYQECGRRFSYIVDETQVVDTTLHRSQIMRSDSDFAKVYTSFMSEPTIMYNKIYSAIEQANSNPTKENIDKRNSAIASSVASVVAVSFVTAFLYDAFKAPDDDDDKEKYLARALEALKGNMIGNVMGTIPIVKDIFSIIQGYTSERMELAGVNDFVVSAKGVYKYAASVANGEAPKQNILFVVRDTLKKAGDLYGIPASNVVKQVEMIFKNYVAQTNDFELVYHMEKLFTNINNSDNRTIYTGILTKELLQARADGDKTKAIAIYDDMVLNGIPVSKIEASVKGKITKALTNKSEIVETGMMVNEWNDLPENEKTATKKAEVIKKYDAVVAKLVKEGYTAEEVDKATKLAAKSNKGVTPSLDRFYKAYMEKDPNAEAMYDKLVDAGYTDDDLRAYIESKGK